MAECPYCKEEVKDDARKCKHCGSVIAMQEPEHGGTCPYCKESVHPEAIKCRHCGSNIGPRMQSSDFAGRQVPSGSGCGCGTRPDDQPDRNLQRRPIENSALYQDCILLCLDGNLGRECGRFCECAFLQGKGVFECYGELLGARRPSGGLSRRLGAF